jgi:hypothetical protein
MEKEKHSALYNLRAAFLLLGISIIVAALVFGFFFYQTRAHRDYVQVVGSASQEFISDIIKWNITFEENTDLVNVRDGYRNIQEKRERLINVLIDKGISHDDINISPITIQKRWNRDGEVIGYVLNQPLFIITSEVEAIEKLALNPDALLDQNIFFQISSLEDLLELATRNARERVEMILRESGHKPGKMIWAQAGVFQIVEPYSTEVESYGMYNTSSRKKEIKVTVHAQFLIQ